MIKSCNIKKFICYFFTLFIVFHISITNGMAQDDKTSSTPTPKPTSTKICNSNTNYVQWMIQYSKDNSHVYSQARRFNNPDVDCSSFVYYALLNNGFTKKQIGESAFTTFSMGNYLKTSGFQEIPYSQAKNSLKAGDILVSNVSGKEHTEVYIGNGQTVGAHGGDADGKPGDSSGNEVSVIQNSVHDSIWQYVYRNTKNGGCIYVTPDPNFWDQLFNSDTEYVCGGIISDRFATLLGQIYKTITTLAVVVVIVLGALDFFKATSSDDADAMKKSWSKFIKRLIAAILLAILPVVLEFIFGIFGFETMKNCLNYF